MIEDLSCINCQLFILGHELESRSFSFAPKFLKQRLSAHLCYAEEGKEFRVATLFLQNQKIAHYTERVTDLRDQGISRVGFLFSALLSL